MTDHPSRILLVDCDQFFVQVARLVDPEGAGKEELLLVGGSASGRGVVTSASYAARAYGVRSAMPTARALELCPDAVVVPVPRAACGRKSREVRTVLAELSPVVQAASVDEFYLDISGTERLFGGETTAETAERIRTTIEGRTDISVSVGGGTTKLVAKLATGLAKPAGVHVVEPGTERMFMRRFDLREIPGVGPALLEELNDRGLHTVDDVLPVDRRWLEGWFGESRGRWLYDRIRGIDPAPVSEREPRKSVSSERTFPRDLSDDENLETELMKQAMSAAAGMRRHGLRARTVTVKLRGGDFTTRQASHTPGEPVGSDRAVFEVARDLLHRLRAERSDPVRLLGVALTNLEEATDPRQLTLFPDGGPGGDAEDPTLTRAVDELRERFGSDAVVPGRVVGGRTTEENGGTANDPVEEGRLP